MKPILPDEDYMNLLTAVLEFKEKDGPVLHKFLCDRWVLIYRHLYRKLHNTMPQSMYMANPSTANVVELSAPHNPKCLKSQHIIVSSLVISPSVTYSIPPCNTSWTCRSKPLLCVYFRAATENNWLIDYWLKYAYLSNRDPCAGRKIIRFPDKTTGKKQQLLHREAV